MTKGQEIPAEVGRWLDELYTLLFEPKPKGGEQAMTCPNCDADMEYDEETGVWQCPECNYLESTR